MSIAFDYAKKMEEYRKIKAPHFDANPRPGGGINGFVGVSVDGNLDSLGFTFTPKQAIELAKWILRTFGDQQ